jgi:hypothetical protein
MSKTYVQLMQDEINGLKAERDDARRWLQWVIDIAHAGDAATLASATDAADAWLHREDCPMLCDGCEAVLARGGHCPLDDHTPAALGWAGAAAEASDPDALAQMREAENADRISRELSATRRAFVGPKGR